MILCHTLLATGWSCSNVSGGLPRVGPPSAVAGAVPLQAAHATHDQWSFHTEPECAPLFLPRELHLLPGPLQPQRAYPQVLPGPGTQQRVGVVSAICMQSMWKFFITHYIYSVAAYWFLVYILFSLLSNIASSPTKLLCFTCTSSLIHQLPAQYPSSIHDAQTFSDAQQTLHNQVFSNPSQLVVCKLSSHISQNSIQELLRQFVKSANDQVSINAWENGCMCICSVYIGHCWLKSASYNVAIGNLVAKVWLNASITLMITEAFTQTISNPI